MKLNDTLIRERDGKAFRVTWLAHWSDIESDDGEKDTVKWYGGDGLYASASNGGTYVLRAGGGGS